MEDDDSDFCSPEGKARVGSSDERNVIDLTTEESSTTGKTLVISSSHSNFSDLFGDDNDDISSGYADTEPCGDGKDKKKNKNPKAKKSKEKDSDIKEVYEEPLPTYSVGLAKSSRAKCVQCDEYIEKNVLRANVYYPNSMFSSFQHLKCTVFHPRVPLSEIDGYDSLIPDQQREIDKRLKDSPLEYEQLNAPLEPDDLVRKQWTTEAEPPSTLLMPLLPYQKEGLSWMMNQETSLVRGGILADEMGMGKTIQMISLMLSHTQNKDNKELMDLWDKSDLMHAIAEKGSCYKTVLREVISDEPMPVVDLSTTTTGDEVMDLTGKDGKEAKKKKPRKKKAQMEFAAIPVTAEPPNYLRAGTLLVLPTVAIRQWQTEIARFTQEGSMTVQVYHGSDRESSLTALTQTDIVITSYKILESEYRKATAGTKVPCRLCGRRLYPDKLRLHRRYYCGADAERTEAQSKTQRKRKSSSNGSSSKVAGDVSSDDDSDNAGDLENGVGEEIDEIALQKISNKKNATKNKGGGKKSAALKRKSIKEEDEEDDTPAKISKPSRTSAKMKSLNYSEDIAGEDEDTDRDEMVKTSAQKGTKSRKTSASKSKKGKGKKSDTADSDDDYEMSDSIIDNEDDEDGANEKERVPDIKPEATTFVQVAPVAGEEEGDLKAKVKSEKKPKGKKKDTTPWEDPEVEADIAAALLKAAKVKTPDSKLHKLSWFRIVLDEAHMIKDRSTSTAKAVFNLISLYKWCLTGTPLQNRVGELYSLVRFLRFDPHAFYMCRSKNCHCKSLHYRFSKGVCEDCGHTAMQHSCHFNREILNPIMRYGYVDLGKKAMLKLKNEVLDEILLRRTKTLRADDIQLPPRIVKVRKEALDEKEEDFYTAIYSQSKAQFSTYVNQGTVLNNYANIFEVLMRLRQAIDHPYLVIYSNTQHDAGLRALSDANVALKKKQQQQALEKELEETYCGLCKDIVENARCADCGHIFCFSCISDYISTVGSSPQQAKSSSDKKSSKKSKKEAATAVTGCPMCDDPLSIDLDAVVDINTLESQGKLPTNFTSSSSSGGGDGNSYGNDCSNLTSPTNTKFVTKRRKSILDKVDLNNFHSSTKIEALMQELYKMREKDLGAKAIVFSQFTSMLDLVEYRINNDNSSGYDTRNSNANISSTQAPPMKCDILSGNMSIDQRDKIVQRFNSDPSHKVLLISLKAGGVALNLTVANHIFILDPWWNPAAEFQAIDRTHRFGQHKPIHATRFIMENTIEERILDLQEKKLLVFDGTIGGDAGSLGRLTAEDLSFLFH